MKTTKQIDIEIKEAKEKIKALTLEKKSRENKLVLNGYINGVMREPMQIPLYIENIEELKRFQYSSVKITIERIKND